MSEIDTLTVLRTIYGDKLTLHSDLYEKSNTHREQHGSECTVHPSSPATAPLWPLLAAIVRARRCLEVGCGLGYTAALMAEAGGRDCHVDTIEAVQEHADLAEEEFSERGLADRIRVLRGQARDVLLSLSGPYDIIFVDADWREYPDFLPHLSRLTRPGGILVTSNLFPLFETWARDMPGKEAIKAYLAQLMADSRFRSYIIPGTWKALSYRVL